MRVSGGSETAVSSAAASRSNVAENMIQLIVHFPFLRNVEIRLPKVIVDFHYRGFSLKNLESDRYTCELREGKLVIAYKMEGVVNRLRFGSDDTKITIYLPAGLTFPSCPQINAANTTLKYCCSKRRTIWIGFSGNKVS